MLPEAIISGAKPGRQPLRFTAPQEKSRLLNCRPDVSSVGSLAEQRFHSLFLAARPY
jgi:hypothetical protein